MLQDLGSDRHPILLTLFSLPTLLPNSVFLPLISRKFAGITLLATSIHILLLQRKTPLTFLPLLLRSHLFGTKWGQSFHSTHRVQHQPRKDPRLLVPLPEVLKGDKLTSQHLGMPRPSLPQPRIRPDTRHAHPSSPNIMIHYSIYPLISRWFCFLLLLPKRSQLLLS